MKFVIILALIASIECKPAAYMQWSGNSFTPKEIAATEKIDLMALLHCTLTIEDTQPIQTTTDISQIFRKVGNCVLGKSSLPEKISNERMNQQASTKILLDVLARNLEKASRMKDNKMEAQNLSKTEIKSLLRNLMQHVSEKARDELISDHPITIKHFTRKTIDN